MALGAYNYKLEVYNQANSSKLCEFVRADLFSGEVVSEMNGEESLTFQIARNHAEFEHIALFNVVRLYDTYESTYVVYRIKRIKQWRQNRKLLAEVYCEHLKYDLAARIIPLEKHFVQENPQTILDYILGYSGGFTRGTCPSIPVMDFDLGFESCMEAIKRLAEQTIWPWRVKAGASPDYKVVEICNVENDSVSIDYGTNLVSISYEQTVENDFATRLVPRGGAALPDQRKLDTELSGCIKPVVMDVAGASFIVKAWDNGTYWLQVTSAKLLAANDALNGFYAYVADEVVEIVDSAVDSDGDKIQLESRPTKDINVGDRVYIFQSSSEPSVYVPDLGLETTYLRTEQVFRADDMPDILNVIGPEGYSDLSGTYTSGLCQGWTKIGSPTVTENTDTDYIRTGTKSQKVVAADTEGIKRSVDCGFAFVASFYVWVYVSSIAEGAKLKVRLAVSDTEYFPQNADTGEDEAYITSTGWRQIIVEGGVFSEAGSHDLEILADGGAVTFYLDSAMVQLSEYITEEDVFYGWDSRVTLWENAAAELDKVSEPAMDYNLEIVDLYEASRSEYPLYEIVAGGWVDINDSGMGLSLESLQIRRKTWNLVKPWEARLEVTG